MNGDPWLVADRADAEMWSGADGNYERILALGTFDTMVDVGDTTGLVLSSDYDDSTVEVFRVSTAELLIVGVRHADDEPYSVLLADAVEVSLEESGTLSVRSGEIAILAPGLRWSEAEFANRLNCRGFGVKRALAPPPRAELGVHPPLGQVPIALPI